MDLETLKKIEEQLDLENDKFKLEYSAKTMASIINDYKSRGIVLGPKEEENES